MINRIKSILFIGYTVLVIIASILFYIWLAGDPEPGTITQGPIQYNTIAKDPYKMPLEDLQNDLQCFYNGFPLLGIQSTGGDEYMLSASLCERKWQRLVNIRPRDSPNVIIVGTFIDSQLRIGGKVDYYRFYGKFGFGGGVMASNGYINLNGGVAYKW